MDSLANLLASGIKEAAESTGVPVFQAREGSMLSLFFAGQEVLDLKSAKKSDVERYRRFFHSMLTLGYYLSFIPD